MPRTDAVTAYLRRVGYDGDLTPTLATLVGLHRAHLDAVPYENLEIMLGRPPSVDPELSLARIGAVGRAGYCFHQNGSLGVVLAALGFAMSRRPGHVHTAVDDPDTSLNHLVLVAEALPTADNPAGRWWVDVGLGDAFREPMPITVGRHDQHGFDYEITRVDADGWSFRRTGPGSFTAVDVRAGSTDRRAVEAAHARLSAPGHGRFAQVLVVQRRDGTGIDTVRGCLHRRTLPTSSSETVLSTYELWRAALADGTRLALGDIEEDELRALYARTWAEHAAWEAAGRP